MPVVCGATGRESRHSISHEETIIRLFFLAAAALVFTALAAGMSAWAIDDGGFGGNTFAVVAWVCAGSGAITSGGAVFSGLLALLRDRGRKQ